MLVLNRALGEEVYIEPVGIRVVFLGFSRDGIARIGFAAPNDQDVIRGELKSGWKSRAAGREKKQTAKARMEAMRNAGR